MLRLRAALVGLVLLTCPWTGAPAMAAAPPTPSDGYYSWYEFDCTECGGAYGTWEVDLHVAKGSAFFTHVGSKCHGHRSVYFDFSKKQGQRAIKDATVSIKRFFRVDGHRYSVKAHLVWVTSKKARGWVVAGGHGCTAPKKHFKVTVM